MHWNCNFRACKTRVKLRFIPPIQTIFFISRIIIERDLINNSSMFNKILNKEDSLFSCDCGHRFLRAPLTCIHFLTIYYYVFKIMYRFTAVKMFGFKKTYDNVVANARSKGMFVKNMALAIIRHDDLSRCSISGTVSNRTKNTAKPALDATKLLAVRGD